MKGTAGLPPVRIIDLLVEGSARNEKVERRLKGLLGIVKDRVEAVPARRPERAGGVDEAGKGHGHDLVRGVHERHLVHDVGLGIVEVLVALDAAAETADAHQVRLDVRAPLGLGPRGAALLETDGGVGGEGRGAASRRGVQGVAAGVGADAVVVDLVEIVVAVAGQGLLLRAKGHSC